MPPRRPTILDVAHAAGVSSATVSRVINGSDTVDKALSRRVHAAVRAVGYVPSAAGRSLRRGGTSLIAVVTPDGENPYFTRITAEVERIARSQNHGVLIAHTEDSLDLEHRTFEQLVSRQVAGVVLIPVDRTRTDLSPLTGAHIPLVLVDRWVEGAATDLVATDNVDAGAQAALHLYEQGYKHPMIIAGPPSLQTTEDRVAGFRRIWSDVMHVDLSASEVHRGDLGFESGRTLTTQVLRGAEIDSLYVTNNRMSAGAFAAMRGLSQAPALLATDDDLWTSLVTPSVSVVSQPVRGTGRAAARMLGQRMADPDEEPSTTLLRSKIIARESTARRTSQGLAC